MAVEHTRPSEQQTPRADIPSLDHAWALQVSSGEDSEGRRLGGDSDHEGTAVLLEALDRRRLLFGVSVLLIVVGACLVIFSSGGLLNAAYLPNPRVVAPREVGLAELLAMSREEEIQRRFAATYAFEWRVDLWQPGPLAGSILVGLGSLGLLLAYAWRPRPS